MCSARRTTILVRRSHEQPKKSRRNSEWNAPPRWYATDGESARGHYERILCGINPRLYTHNTLLLRGNCDMPRKRYLTNWKLVKAQRPRFCARNPLGNSRGKEWQAQNVERRLLSFDQKNNGKRFESEMLTWMQFKVESVALRVLLLPCPVLYRNALMNVL